MVLGDLRDEEIVVLRSPVPLGKPQLQGTTPVILGIVVGAELGYQLQAVEHTKVTFHSLTFLGTALCRLRAVTRDRQSSQSGYSSNMGHISQILSDTVTQWDGSVPSTLS